LTVEPQLHPNNPPLAKNGNIDIFIYFRALAKQAGRTELQPRIRSFFFSIELLEQLSGRVIAFGQHFFLSGIQRVRLQQGRGQVFGPFQIAESPNNIVLTFVSPRSGPKPEL